MALESPFNRTIQIHTGLGADVMGLRGSDSALVGNDMYDFHLLFTAVTRHGTMWFITRGIKVIRVGT